MFHCYVNFSILILHILKPSGFINPSSRNILVIMDLSTTRMIIQKVFSTKNTACTSIILNSTRYQVTPGFCSSLSTAPPPKKKVQQRPFVGRIFSDPDETHHNLIRKKNSSQKATYWVIQAVIFSSPSWRSLVNHWTGSRFYSPSQKGHRQNCHPTRFPTIMVQWKMAPVGGRDQPFHLPGAHVRAAHNYESPGLN